MIRHVPLIVATMLVLATTGVLAQEGSAVSTPDVAYWVDYWSRPPVNLFGPEQEEFNKKRSWVIFCASDDEITIKSFGMMVARDGLEPPTPAFSGLDTAALI